MQWWQGACGSPTDTNVPRQRNTSCNMHLLECWRQHTNQGRWLTRQPFPADKAKRMSKITMYEDAMMPQERAWVNIRCHCAGVTASKSSESSASRAPDIVLHWCEFLLFFFCFRHQLTQMVFVHVLPRQARVLGIGEHERRSFRHGAGGPRQSLIFLSGRTSAVLMPFFAWRCLAYKNAVRTEPVLCHGRILANGQ